VAWREAAGAATVAAPRRPAPDLSSSRTPFAESDDPAEVRDETPALTIEQQQALALEQAQRMVTIRNADGSETLNHDGAFADYSVLRIGPDGRLVRECISGVGSEKDLFKNRPQPRPAMEDR
jgi:hypothetical protein